MTEAEWLTCNDPRPMLRSLNMRLRAAGRKQGDSAGLGRLRSFALACCRRIWRLLREEDREAVQFLEAVTPSPTRKDLLSARKTHRPARVHASNEMSRVQRDHPNDEYLVLTAWAHNIATSAVWEATAPRPTTAANAHLSAARAVGAIERAAAVSGSGANPASGPVTLDWHFVSQNEFASQAGLLREVFGSLPFRPAKLSPSTKTATVVSLATAIYTDRAFDRLPILSDALEDAGCTDRDILDHCRQPAEHVRGCWVVDLVLCRS